MRCSSFLGHPCVDALRWHGIIGPDTRFAARAPISPRTDFGWALLGVPLAGTLLIWFWVTGLALIQGPGSALAGIVVGVVILTAALAAIEAGKLGMTTDRARGSYSPGQWMFMCLFLWVIGFPAYLFKRRHYGRANLLLWALVVEAVFGGSAVLIGNLIEEKTAKLQSQIENLTHPKALFAPSGSQVQSAPEAAEVPQSLKSPPLAPAANNGDLETVTVKDPAAARTIAKYCKDVARSIPGSALVEQGCRTEEIEAWRRLKVEHEFSQEVQQQGECSQPDIDASFALKEDCLLLEQKARRDVAEGQR